MSTDTLPPLRDVIAKYDLAAKKSLGQHFLLDLNLTGRVARAAGDLTKCTVIEIGPGPGGLTRALLAEGAKKVIAIERDQRPIAALNEIAAAYPGRLEIIEGDALEINPASLCNGPRKIVANLPYNISTQLVLNWLENITDYERLTLMFQKEVADRLAAQPRSKEYGRLSVLTQWLCDVRTNFNIKPSAFTPPPKVMSTVASLVPHEKPLVEVEQAKLERVTQAAFGQRRKMLRASLKTLGVNGEELAKKAGIEPTKRAEELSVQDFCALVQALD
ncbi:Ribosomal RNA small subunit methyltransferase A [Candidatus Terasakiella magnetica]|uniref:Ribosomal RNA small subunit methyltransferase A n=1 Tax=Candidatus Terasakiella magnetica TaxID=1867952 RepID=A0A1C3RK37_9PROT|nr:16S rRNA (adenine(1518)-N(6)/adenine(1519)-N(6))-dimethyltransferase RsmA [Candidatus Terasakiella magnetica]SCA57652.1 Ribosomal RNA small subunit methyltransferase A [Candidatus Terasakiella magnetica]